MTAYKRRTTNDDGTTGRTTCTECGAPVRQRDKYCWQCGSKFEGFEKEKDDGVPNKEKAQADAT